MEVKRNTTSRNNGIEENTMAILDSSGIKDSKDLLDDRLAFLEAVRASSLVSESGSAPSSKMFEAIFHILKDSTSLELTMTSYQLLIELDKRFPRVYISHSNTSESSGSRELVVLEEAWSPFALGPVIATYRETDRNYRNSNHPLDSLGFCHLTENIAREVNEVNFQVPAMKLIGEMMLFQYLLNVLQTDFVSRNTIYKETKDWACLRDSSLNVLLVSLSSRRMYKGLMKDCMSILSRGGHHFAGVTSNDLENEKMSSGKTVRSCGIVFTFYFGLKEGTCVAIQQFFSQIMELDVIKKQADLQGQTSRADGLRTPLLEIILDELTYDEELFSSFLQVIVEIVMGYFCIIFLIVFSNPNWKLEVILQFFSKYLKKPSIRTRRSSESTEDATLTDVLRSFSSETSTKAIIKKISADVAQLLLAHAFQVISCCFFSPLAKLTLHRPYSEAFSPRAFSGQHNNQLAYLKLQHHIDHVADSSENVRGSSVLQTCKDIIAAFDNLRKADK
ncbi:hypothetical protein IFM89_010866 [Coptis chinensis]|uniref:Negative regulator of systemic acquired resistance SNI1 n=1 Tax=Coptis chinensis TaxID=261450 RepID=A0A835I1B2_9MAGN|nr:hypothetical protein IFM89_010866 [Coptis chinensis]